MEMITTIQLNKKLKQRLDSLKIHHRETYNELITRLISNSNPQNFDKESLRPGSNRSDRHRPPDGRQV